MNLLAVVLIAPIIISVIVIGAMFLIDSIEDNKK